MLTTRTIGEFYRETNQRENKSNLFLEIWRFFSMERRDGRAIILSEEGGLTWRIRAEPVEE